MALRIGQLLISMGTDVAQIKSDMEEVKRINRDAVADVQQAWGGVQEVLGLAGLSLGLRELVSGFLDLAAEMRNVGAEAQKVGVSVEQFETFSYALQLAGGDAEKAQTALGMLDKTVTQAASGSAAAQEKFRALGIEYENADHSARDAYAVMRDLADVFAAHADGATKTAWALALFGRSGKELIPVLDEGSASLDAMNQHLKELGAQMSPEQLEHARQFEKSWLDMKEAWHGAAMEIEDTLLPDLTALGRAVANLVSGSGQRAPMVSSGEIWSDIYHWLAGKLGLGVPEGVAEPGALGSEQMGPPAPGWSDQLAGVEPLPMSAFASAKKKPMPGIPQADATTQLQRMVDQLEKQQAKIEDNSAAWQKYELAVAALKNPNEQLFEQGVRLVDQMEEQQRLKQEALAVQGEMSLAYKGELDYRRQLEDVSKDEIRMEADLTEARLKLAQSTENLDQVQRELLEAKLDTQFAKEVEQQRLEGEALQQLIREYMAYRDARLQILSEEQQQMKSWSAGWDTAFRDFAQSAGDNAATAKRVFDTFVNGTVDQLTNLMMTGKADFKSLADSIIADMLRANLRKLLAGSIGGGGDFGGIGSFLGNLFGGGGGGGSGGGTVAPSDFGGFGSVGFSSIPTLAGGGDISGPAIVGERGPELFIPSTSGRIIPNGSAALHVTNAPNIFIDSRTDQAQISQLLSNAMQASEGRIYENMRRGGAFSRASR